MGISHQLLHRGQHTQPSEKPTNLSEMAPVEEEVAPKRQKLEKLGILERLAAGPVIGDGGFVFELEKRGYVKAGPWTPEAAVEDPEAVKQLHREFLRAGADVMQAFTFYASEDKLTNRGNKAGKTIGVEAINRAASKLAKEVADEGGALTLGGLSQCPTYLSGMSKADVQKEFKKQIDVFVSEGDMHGVSAAECAIREAWELGVRYIGGCC